MKNVSLLFILIVLNLLLLNCASQNKIGKNPGIIDTVYVRDTTIIVEKNVFVNAMKMNVLYIGVDNPVELDVAGVNPNNVHVQISGAGGKISRQDDRHYLVSVTNPGDVRITINGDGVSESFEYRAKRIPDPVARLSNSSGGEMGNGEFKAQAGLGVFLENFDFEAVCNIQGFRLTMIPKRQDPVEVINAGARFNDQSQRLINQAKPGDIYIFSDVKARCPEDVAGRSINTLAFKIK